jgi:hypothetical protein
MKSEDLKPEIVAQTENFIAWRVDEPESETTYHLDINNITVHFFVEEWDSFIDFIGKFPENDKSMTGVLAENDDYLLSKEKIGEDDVYVLELINASIFIYDYDWVEFKQLVKELK